MNAQQHLKLAQHYHARYEALAQSMIYRSLSGEARPARHTVMDYHTMFRKYLDHKQAAAALCRQADQEATARGLLALGTVQPAPQCQPVASASAHVHAKDIATGGTYYRHGDRNQKAFTVLAIADTYQHTTMASYRAACVRWTDGTEGDHRIYANQRYVPVSAPVTVDDDYGVCRTCGTDLGYGDCVACLEEQRHIQTDQRPY